MEGDLFINTILSALFAWCALYAVFLERIQHIYSPDYIWITVVFGDGFVVLAFAAFAFHGLIPWLAWWLLVKAMCAAGAPVIIWQLIQAAKRRGARGTVQEEAPHAAVHQRRESGH